MLPPPRPCFPDAEPWSRPRTLLSGDICLVPELGCILDKVHGQVLITWIICKTELKNSNCEGRFSLQLSPQRDLEIQSPTLGEDRVLWGERSL